MIFFVIHESWRKDLPAHIKALKTANTTTKLTANLYAPTFSNPRIIAWNEVYPATDADPTGLDGLLEAIRKAASVDPVCADMLFQARRRHGIAPFLREGRDVGPEIPADEMRATVAKILLHWAHPMVGNIANFAKPRPTVENDQIDNWTESTAIDAKTKTAIKQLTQTLPALDREPRDQVRIVYNIVDLARAMIGEITTETSRRLEKLAALELCKSDKLLSAQQAMLLELMQRRRTEVEVGVTRTSDKDQKGMEWFEYTRYFLPSLAAVQSPEWDWHLVDNLISIATNGGHVVSSDAQQPVDLLGRCLEKWRELPNQIQCAILLNDLRRADGKSNDFGPHKSNTASVGFTESTRDSLQKPLEQPFSLPYGVFPAPDNTPLPTLYSQGKPTSWTRDERSPVTIAYRHFLCPIWGGPSGHVPLVAGYWRHALAKGQPDGTEDKFGREGLAVVASSLFALWRLYYDKRVSVNHTLAETFEATLSPIVEDKVTGLTFESFSSKMAGVDADGFDAFDLVRIATRKSPESNHIDPVVLFRLLEARHYDPSNAQQVDHGAAYAALGTKIDNLRAEFEANGLLVPRFTRKLREGEAILDPFARRPQDRVPNNGAPDDGVPDDGVPNNGVPNNGAPADGQPANPAANPVVDPSGADPASAAADAQGAQPLRDAELVIGSLN